MKKEKKMSWELFSACPACGKGGSSMWNVEECNHQAFIWPDLEVGCQCCSKYRNILDWNYDCKKRNCSYSRRTNVFGFLEAVNALAESYNIPTNIWKYMNKKLLEIAKEKLG